MGKPHSQEGRAPDLPRVLGELRKVRDRKVESQGVTPQLALLRAFQAERLERTYADLMTDSRYREFGQFFLTDIYGGADYTQRNHDMAQLHGLLQRMVPEPLYHPLSLIVELHALTDRLDGLLLERLTSLAGYQGAVTAPLYAEAYRLCDNYRDRVRQIDLIDEILMDLDEVVHARGSGLVLKMARGPARVAGWGEMAGLVERGFRAFKQLGSSAEFRHVIKQRETRILDRIWAGEADPFS
jgi:hypothetical protein